MGLWLPWAGNLLLLPSVIHFDRTVKLQLKRIDLSIQSIEHHLKLIHLIQHDVLPLHHLLHLPRQRVHTSVIPFLPLISDFAGPCEAVLAG